MIMDDKLEKALQDEIAFLRELLKVKVKEIKLPDYDVQYVKNLAMEIEAMQEDAAYFKKQIQEEKESEGEKWSSCDSRYYAFYARHGVALDKAEKEYAHLTAPESEKPPYKVNNND